MSMHRFMMSYNFDQVPYVDIGWWKQPTYTFNGTNVMGSSLIYDFNGLMWDKTQANTALLVKYGPPSGQLAYTFMQVYSVATGQTINSVDITNPEAATVYPKYGNPVTQSNSGNTFFVCTNEVVRLTVANATSHWSTNSNTNIYDAVATDDVIVIGGRGATANPNSWIRFVNHGDGTTVQNTYTACTLFLVSSSQLRKLYTNEAQNMIFWFGRNSTSGTCYFKSFWAANGVLYSSNTCSRALGYMTMEGSDRADSSNVLYMRGTYVAQTDDFCKVVCNTKPPTISWGKTVPAGNIVSIISPDGTGNCYVGQQNGDFDFVLSKVDTNGSALWSRSITELRTGTFKIKPLGLIADSEQFVIWLQIVEMFFEPKWGTWFEGSSQEDIMLRLPSSGANTGSYNNVSYASITTQTFTSWSGSYTTAFDATDYSPNSTLESNTMTVTANSGKNITANTI